MDEAPFSFTRKIGNDLATVRGNDIVEFRANFVTAFGEESWEWTFGNHSGEGAVSQSEVPATHAERVQLVKDVLGGQDVVPPPLVSAFDAPDPSDTRQESGRRGLSAAQQAALDKLKVANPATPKDTGGGES